MEVDDNYSGMTVIESGLRHFMVLGEDFLNIDDYMTIGALTKTLREYSFAYVRVLVYKMTIASENDHISTLTIYAKNDREVFRRSGNRGAIIDFLNYLKIAKAEPLKLDVRSYSHNPLDNVMEILHEYSNLETVAMNPKCTCIGDCLGLDRNPLMKDIESISPGAFLNNSRSVNSVTIEADLPVSCFDLVFNNNSLHIRASEQVNIFEASIKMMARCLRIQKANSTKMDQKYFAKLLSKMRVEELILLPIANEGTEMLNDQGAIVRHACIGCSDLMFAKIADSKPLPVYWDDTEPKMTLKQLEYTALDMIPCTAIVDRMCSWFEVKRRMSLIFPKKRFRDDLMFDLDALCPYLKEFKGDVIILTFKCIKLTTKNGCARLCEEMAEMFERKGFRVMRTHFDAEKERFELDLDQNYVEKKIVVDFVRPPPSLDIPMEIPDFFVAFYGNENRY